MTELPFSRTLATATLAWLAGLVMVALALSVAGLMLAPVAIPVAGYAVTRTHSWLVRVPLLIGAVALTLLVGAWLADGATTGTTIPGRVAG
jgi:hypothetical protein